MDNDLTFIESQFPVSKLSKESYKERKSGGGQTLPVLGKWWGRKPLIMVRAAILGLLLPASDDPRRDREIFLKVLTMDEDGLWQRKSKAIALKDLIARLTPPEQARWFELDAPKPRYKRGTSREEKAEVQRLVFQRLSYDDKLRYCDRPEQIAGPSGSAWADINAYLGTEAADLPALIQQLGQRRFGHTPRVGDAFCGGGSVPFEAARIGCEAYGSDLNPVAALLTWGALNIVGGGEQVAIEVRKAQEQVYDVVDRQITDWGIEHNEDGHRADAYLYCTETRCPECHWMVPLAPSWVIGENTMTLARLAPDEAGKRFEIEVHQGVSAAELRAAKTGTVRKSRLECPHCGVSTPMSAIRGDRRGGGTTDYGLRLWENDDLAPRPDDVFQERLYCIRWVDTWIDDNGKPQRERYYRAPKDADWMREGKVLELLRERFDEWQAQGYIPNRKIETGAETTRLMRERGWTHWHHLFNSRQLLVLGCISETSNMLGFSQQITAALLLSVGRSADFNSRLSRWAHQKGYEVSNNVFSNQALNTVYNYGTRALEGLAIAYYLRLEADSCNGRSSIESVSVDKTNFEVDLWITDPPYADAVNYHELSEFFLAWYGKPIISLFPQWSPDSKRKIAIRGSGKAFRQGMVDAYHNLATHMPDNGLQVVMFTHQDAGVWADLALILWAAGLRVTAAWTIATETESALKAGNYVQGTVLMVLRKQTSDTVAFLDEIVPQVEIEVESQLQAMLALDDREDPNFSDSDYQLAAYAAALRVLTQYQGIEDIDVSYELSRERKRGEESPIEAIIEDAVRTASNFLVPDGIDPQLWKRLSPEEKLYLKCLEVESHGDYRSGVFQEFARGFGVRDYSNLLHSGKANQTRLRTASEFKRREWGTDGFGSSLLRHILFAIYQSGERDDPKVGLTYFNTELPDYWTQRDHIAGLLRFIARLAHSPMDHWVDDAETAALLAGTVENDHV